MQVHAVIAIPKITLLKKQQNIFQKLLQETQAKEACMVCVYNSIPEEHSDDKESAYSSVTQCRIKAQEYQAKIDELQKAIILIKTKQPLTFTEKNKYANNGYN